MLVIDFHTHMFPDKLAGSTLDKIKETINTPPCTDGTAKGLEKSSIEAGVDISIVLPPATRAKQTKTINEFAANFTEGRVISFGGIHPELEDYKGALRDIKAKGLRGIKLHPDYQSTRFNDIRYKRIIEYATELDLIVVAHAGRDPLCPMDVHNTPKMALEVIREVQPEKLVLAHLGGNRMYNDVEKYLVGENVYFDISNTYGKLTMEQFVRIMKNHGMDKMLFATDSPWRSQKESIREIDYFPFNTEEREMLFSGNALRLLGMTSTFLKQEEKRCP